MSKETNYTLQLSFIELNFRTNKSVQNKVIEIILLRLNYKKLHYIIQMNILY